MDIVRGLKSRIEEQGFRVTIDASGGEFEAVASKNGQTVQARGVTEKEALIALADILGIRIRVKFSEPRRPRPGEVLG